MRLFGVSIWREAPGVISPGFCWCATYGCWMHCTGSLVGLWSLITEWQHDRHVVGRVRLATTPRSR
jgi:hypothetical protein